MKHSPKYPETGVSIDDSLCPPFHSIIHFTVMETFVNTDGEKEDHLRHSSVTTVCPFDNYRLIDSFVCVLHLTDPEPVRWLEGTRNQRNKCFTPVIITFP